MPYKPFFFILLTAVWISGCTLAKVDVEVLSERTALENQVLGTYNALDNEMLLAASVRGVDARGNIRKPPIQSGEQKDVLTAMRLTAFHEDDVQLFKKLGWVGENNDGLLSPFPMDMTTVPEDLAETAGRFTKEEFDYILSQVHDSRMVIMKRVIALNEDLTDEDFPKIKKVFAKMNAEKLNPGEKYQTTDGIWLTKP